MIIASAIKIKDGSVFIGKRHGECCEAIRKQYPINEYPDIFKNNITGFITHKNEFVDREEAAIIAVKYKQVIPMSIDPVIFQKVFPALFSEDLY